MPSVEKLESKQQLLPSLSPFVFPFAPTPLPRSSSSLTPFLLSFSSLHLRVVASRIIFISIHTAVAARTFRQNHNCNLELELSSFTTSISKGGRGSFRNEKLKSCSV